MRGADWKLLPDGAAPRAVMAPDLGADEGWDVAGFVQHHIRELGFNAIHRPLQGETPAAADRELAELADDFGFLLLIWMYGDVQGGTAPDDALGRQHNREHQLAVVDFYRPFRNVAIGLGYDPREWANDNEGNRWYKRLKEHHRKRLYGIRARLDEDRRDPDGPDPDGGGIRQGYRPGDYASFEVQLTDADGIAEILEAARSPVLPGEPHVHRPVINAERFRIGPREKDLQGLDQLLEVMGEYRAANVGAIYGIRDAGPNWRWPTAWRAAIAAANRGEAPPSEPPAPAPIEIPAAADVEILHPGTEIRGWPVVSGPVNEALVRHDGIVELEYPEKDWPSFHTISTKHQHIGVAWMIWHDGSGWKALPEEHLQADEREVRRTSFRPELARPKAGDIVGFIVAGPSRHVTDRPEYRRRTAPTWWRWGIGEMELVAEGFAAAGGDEGDDPVPDPPEPPPAPPDPGPDPPPAPPDPEPETDPAIPVQALDTIEEIMTVILSLIPLIEKGFALATAVLEHDTEKDAHDLKLLELMSAEQRAAYLDQIMRDRERRAKNLDFWQTIADHAGDLIDGDAWKRLRAELEDGLEEPAES